MAAVASCLDIRSRRGRWLLRIEDIDPPREPPGTADAILRTMEAFGFEWDGEVRFQGTCSGAYEEALARLRERGALYPCDCSRRQAAAAAQAAGVPPHIYPGSCRARSEAPRGPYALRVRTAGVGIGFEDLLQGPVWQFLEESVGDFVVRRADGLYAYQLAVVVDDADQGVTEVMRGIDLLDNTPRQIHLQRLLGLPTPAYLHIPIAVDAEGHKLSKQTHAPAVDTADPVPTLWAALDFLGQSPPPELARDGLRELWAFALRHWKREPLRGVAQRPWVGSGRVG